MIIDVGSKIKFNREIKGIKQAKPAELIDISEGYMGKIERNERIPSIDIIVLISKVLNVATDDLLIEEIPYRNKNINKFLNHLHMLDDDRINKIIEVANFMVNQELNRSYVE